MKVAGCDQGLEYMVGRGAIQAAQARHLFTRQPHARHLLILGPYAVQPVVDAECGRQQPPIIEHCLPSISLQICAASAFHATHAVAIGECPDHAVAAVRFIDRWLNCIACGDGQMYRGGLKR